MITKVYLSIPCGINRNSSNCICPVIYLCAVVKERSESSPSKAFTPRMIPFRKIVYASGTARCSSGPPSLRCGAAFFAERKMVGVRGFEPRTLRLSSACSNQLSYTPPNSAGLPSRSSQHSKFSVCSTARPALRVATASLSLRCERRLVELRRLELPTYSLQSYRSTN